MFPMLNFYTNALPLEYSSYMFPRLATNSQQSSCILFLQASVKGTNMPRWRTLILCHSLDNRIAMDTYSKCLTWMILNIFVKEGDSHIFLIAGV